MSFFDDVDEPPTTARRASRTPPRSRRPSGGGRRPPTDQQQILVRRGVAAVAIIIVFVLIAVLVNSCEVSQRKTALKNYNNDVGSLIQQSDSSGATLFRLLLGASSSNVSSLQNSLAEAADTANSLLTRAKKLSVPDQMKTAQTYVQLTMQMRYDGISNIANNIQQALGTTQAATAIDTIAAEMGRLYGSDAVYKDYATHAIAAALKSNGIAVGGTTGEAIVQGQFVPNIQWLSASYVAQALKTSLPASKGGKATPGTHGHALDSVSVAGNQLSSTSTNTITASPAPTFTLSFHNSGSNTEHNVVCKVTVVGTSDSGQTVVTKTTKGQSVTCDVKLSSAPPTGSQQVKAEVEPVLGETNASNNSMTFPVTFQ